MITALVSFYLAEFASTAFNAPCLDFEIKAHQLNPQHLFLPSLSSNHGNIQILTHPQRLFPEVCFLGFPIQKGLELVPADLHNADDYIFKLKARKLVMVEQHL